MRVPTPDDFRELETWGLIERPMAAVEAFSPEHEQRREDNERHRRKRREQEESVSEAFLDDTQAYYRSMERPIDRTKWDYLKRRKAWFHPPVGWERFAAPGVSRILDLGCGDGDQTERIAEFVAGRWRAAGYDGFPMEVVGVDLSESRIENARRHARSPHEAITLRFESGDAVAGLDYPDDYFDYTLALGLLEVLDDDLAEPVLDEVARLTAGGVYVRDLLDSMPGFHPRPDVDERLAERGFETRERHRVLEEPFVEEGTRDPLDVWPMNLHQVVFATATDPVPADERY
ncbi:class I SAM-dependent methyltransferase [Salinirubellus sp. GCM10025818]|uniref:class I SAM-dependent methyltransferase n=1 Tax=Salinirubellus TaxID=2162630 RepID=UPI0030CDC62E